MKKILIPFGILSLISIIIFSVLSSNSYAYFIENQNRLFIEDAVIIKVFDGEVYTTVKDVNEKLNDNYDSYVMYSRDGDIVYVYNHNYDRMLNLKMYDNQVVEQQSGKYTFK